MEELKSESIPFKVKEKAESKVHSEGARAADINQIVKRAIAGSQELEYTPKRKGDRTGIRGLGKEVADAL